MEGLSWVMYANMAVWLGVGGYLLFLARRAVALDRRLRRMEYAATRNSGGVQPGGEA